MALLNGKTPTAWWEDFLNELVMGKTGNQVEEDLEKFTTPDFWRQDFDRIIDRAMLGHHCEFVRSLPDVNEIEVEVRHASFDGEYFAADHTVAGPGGKTGRYKIEVLTFAKIENSRAAWIRELYWSVEGEDTSWTDEFETYPKSAPTS
ncbi:hypothetical protein AB0N65_11195 [Paenarthrobacter sp. NPDC089322]|uniref:hypothetical protein n=1 Tax=Paenarthrobacter sp. NPDC089322 TaxID=3155065 RepID=UPI0034152EDB